MASGSPATSASASEVCWQAYLSTFPATLALLDPIEARMAPIEADAQKRLMRARLLHSVVTSKAAALKLSDLKTMTTEWIHGMLDATFPLESSIVDEGFADGDELALRVVLAALDGAHAVAGKLAALYREAGELKAHPASPAKASRDGRTDKAAASASASSDMPKRPSEVEAAELVRRALASGAPLQEAVSAGVDELQVFGADLWEALLWRRGALRFYMVSTAVRTRLGAADARVVSRASDGSAAKVKEAGFDEGAAEVSAAEVAEAEVAEAAAASIVSIALAAVDLSDHRSAGGTIAAVDLSDHRGAGGTIGRAAAAVTNRHAGTAAGPNAHLIEEAYSALSLLLMARRDPHAALESLPLQLRYGIYSTTHLLGLAFLCELSYWRWAAGAAEPHGLGAVAVASADAADAADHTDVLTTAVVGGGAAPTTAADLWMRRAAVSSHRYLYTVSVLMEGCGWAMEKQRELLGLLSAELGKPAVAAALALEMGVSEREEALRKVDRKAAHEVAAATAASARARGSKKGGINGGGKVGSRG